VAPRVSDWLAEPSVHNSGAVSAHTSVPSARYSEKRSGDLLARTSIAAVRSE
jgi:hypothetical protein